MYLVLVLVAHRIDMLLGVNNIRDGVIIALCVNEVISFVEILGIIGVPLPEVLTNAIDLLSDKKEEASK